MPRESEGPGREPPRLLRLIADLLIRGPESQYVRGDLDESYGRDRQRGMSGLRASLVYLGNALRSAVAIGQARRAGGMRGDRVSERMGKRHRLTFGVSPLDVKLALRMLRKDPALTLVAVFALSIGIPFGLLPFHFLGSLTSPLPVHEGSRVLGVRNWDLEAGRPDYRSIHDYETWQAELETFQLLGATRSTTQNLSTDDGQVLQLPGAVITASGFEVLGVAPLVGRRIIEADEQPGAQPVVVLGHDSWQARFGGDPQVTGTTVRLAGTLRTIVGVMPRDFRFPVRAQFWIPMVDRTVEYERGEGPLLWVFGRLADASTREEAQSEVEALGARTTLAYPATHQNLRAEVELFSLTVLGDFRTDELGQTLLAKIVAILLLAIACGNVGTLLFARAARRTGEIAVRTALGASRFRIIVQLFVEALVIALVATGLGLAFADWLVAYLDPLVGGLPYWIDFSIRPATILMALSLAVFSAIIAGVIPAFKATGGKVQGRLQRAAGGGSGMRFGALSSALIVSEVALSVAFLALMGGNLESALVDRRAAQPLPADEYLAARLSSPVDVAGVRDSLRFAEIQAELLDRLTGEADVRRVALATVLPGMDHPTRGVEVERRPEEEKESAPFVSQVANVDVDFFRSLGVPILAGRDFATPDVAGEAATVIVNRPMVDDLFGGRSPLGRRIRYTTLPEVEPGPWYEVVGVVDDFGMNVNDPQRRAGLYHPIARGSTSVARLLIHVGPDPVAFAPRFRAIAAAVDPTMLISVDRLDEIFSENLFLVRWMTLLLTLLVAISVVLSAAGLYALMSFTVSERTREIGIRSALGARPGRIVSVVLGRAALQLAVGVVIGVGLATVLAPSVDVGFSVATPWPLIYLGAAISVIIVGLAACARPMLRGLRIEPSAALREN